MPGVEPVGDHVVGLAAPDHGGDGGDARVLRRPLRQHRRGQRLLPAHVVQAHPGEHAVVVGRVGPPARATVGAQREPVPAADHAAAVHRALTQPRTQVRAGAGPGVQRPVAGAPGHHLDAGDDPPERAVGAHLVAGREHVPVAGRADLGPLQCRLDQSRLRFPPGRFLLHPRWRPQHPERPAPHTCIHSHPRIPCIQGADGRSSAVQVTRRDLPATTVRQAPRAQTRRPM